MIRYLPYLAGIGVALTWGFSFMFTRGALDYLSPFHLLGLRFATAVIAMAILRALKVIRIRVVPFDYIALLPLAIFQPILYFSAETTGVMLTSASYSGMMIAAIPIFTTILAVFTLHELPTRLQVFFILSTVGGVIFIIFMDNQSITGVNPLGTIALMGAVISAAFFSIASRKASVNYGPLHTTWIMMVVGAVAFNLIAFIQLYLTTGVEQYFAPLPQLWPTVLYLGVVSSVGAFFLFNYVLGKVTAARASVFTNMVTVVAIAAGVTFRGETVYWYHLTGTAAILIGVWGTNRFASAISEPLKSDREATTQSPG